MTSTAHQLSQDDPERPEGLDNCTKDEVRGDLLQPPHKHLTPATNKPVAAVIVRLTITEIY